MNRVLAAALVWTGDASAAAQAAARAGEPKTPADRHLHAIVAAANGDATAARSHLAAADRDLAAAEPTATTPKRVGVIDQTDLIASRLTARWVDEWLSRGDRMPPTGKEPEPPAESKQK